MHLLAAVLFDQRIIRRIHSWNRPIGAPFSPTPSSCALLIAGEAVANLTSPAVVNVKILSSRGVVTSWLLPKLVVERVGNMAFSFGVQARLIKVKSSGAVVTPLAFAASAKAWTRA